MKFSVLRILSVASLLLGVIYLFNAFSGLTGYVVADDVGGNLRPFFGIAFILIGIVVFFGERLDKESKNWKD